MIMGLFPNFFPKSYHTNCEGAFFPTTYKPLEGGGKRTPSHNFYPARPPPGQSATRRLLATHNTERRATSFVSTTVTGAVAAAGDATADGTYGLGPNLKPPEARPRSKAPKGRQEEVASTKSEGSGLWRDPERTGWAEGGCVGGSGGGHVAGGVGLVRGICL